MNDKEIKIYGTLVNHTTDNTVAYARQVMDESFNAGEFQSEINMRVKNIRNENGKTYVDSELVAPTIIADNIIKGGSPVMTAADMSSQQTSSIIRLIAREEVNSVVDGAPATFDTLKEISTWISQHQFDLTQYYTKSEIDNKISGVRNDIPDVQAALSEYYDKTSINSLLQYIRQSIPNMDNYYTKSDITSLLEGLSPQQGNITRLNIYNEQDNSKYSYIECELDRYEEPRIFIPNLYVDDTVEADSINIINDGTIGTLQIMYLDCFNENDPNISVSANLIPDNGRETIGNEDHPWNAVYTGDLEVSGDAYFTGAFGVNAIEPYTDNALRLSGDVQVSGDILPNTEISNTLGSEDYRWNGWFEVLNVGDLYVNGEELPFNNYYTKPEVDALLNVDNILAVLNSGNIHTVSILADTNSDPLDIRCNKFVKHGDNLTVSVYNNADELYAYYDVSIYTPSGRDITDSFTITDNSGTFVINNVNQDILILVVMQSAPIPPLNPDISDIED